MQSPSLINSAQLELDAESFVNTDGHSGPELAASTQRLLNLSSELRNQICEYVLTEENELKCLAPFASPRLRLVSPGQSIYGTFRDFNSLQYVCRQLYKETVGLELKFNTIVFYLDFPNEWGPGAMFLSFVASCPPTKLALLRRVDLTTNIFPRPYPRFEDMTEPPDILRRLAEFCRAHPHARVDYFPGLFLYQWRSSDFFRRGARLSLLLRNIELTGLSQYVVSMASDEENVQGIATDVSNFRFKPAQRGDMRDGVVRGAHLTGYERQLALTWVDEGI